MMGVLLTRGHFMDHSTDSGQNNSEHSVRVRMENQFPRLTLNHRFNCQTGDKGTKKAAVENLVQKISSINKRFTKEIRVILRQGR